MTRFILPLLFPLLLQTTSAQSYPGLWGTIDEEQLSAVTKNYSNGYYATGTIEKYIANPPGDHLDCLVMKFDSLGDTVWVRSFGDLNDNSLRSVAPLPGGGFIAVGNNDSIYSSNSNGLICRFDDAGNPVWQRNLTERFLYLQKIIPCPEGDFIICGTSHMQNYSPKVYLAKIDTNGTFKWIKSWGDYSYGLVAEDFVITADSGIMVCGFTGITKFDKNGGYQWSRFYAFNQTEYIQKLIALPNGQILLAGTVDIDSNGVHEVFIAKLDDSGNILDADIYFSALDILQLTQIVCTGSKFYVTGSTFTPSIYGICIVGDTSGSVDSIFLFNNGAQSGLAGMDCGAAGNCAAVGFGITSVGVSESDALVLLGNQGINLQCGDTAYAVIQTDTVFSADSLYYSFFEDTTITTSISSALFQSRIQVLDKNKFCWNCSSGPGMYIGNRPGCLNDSLIIFNQSWPVPQQIAWYWDSTYVDNADTINIQLAGSTVGEHQLWLIANTGTCFDTLKRTVPVNPAVFASFYTVVNGQTVSFINTSTPGTWPLWLFGDGSNSSQNNPTHTYSTVGNYEVCLEIVGPDGCRNRTCKSDILMSANANSEIEEVFLKLFPNPTNGMLNILTNDEILEVKIVDLQGKEELFSAQDPASPDLSMLPGGFYFVKVITRSGVLVDKILVQK